MNPDDLRSIIAWLQERVTLAQPGSTVVAFVPPGAADMEAAGLHPDGVARVRGAPWWEEMVEDILKTPGLCDPGDAPEQVLAYARDVIAEYIRKRVALD